MKGTFTTKSVFDVRQELKLTFPIQDKEKEAEFSKVVPSAFFLTGADKLGQGDQSNNIIDNTIL